MIVKIYIKMNIYSLIGTPFFMIFNDYITFMNHVLVQNNIYKPVFFWLLLLTFMTFIMIIIGGLTRLTDSGLSIVDWKPIMGAIPPLNKDSWLLAFNSYQNSPEFLIINKNMTLDEFKYIFWWEWIHRFFARCIGVVFILPIIYFGITKKISQSLLTSLLILFLFGLFQAVVGWWMVMSGLNNDPYVSSYRLAFHLTNAVIILTILFWLTLSSAENSNIKFFPQDIKQAYTFITIIFLLITIISGAFMAGSNAGKSFNTYPLMNGKFFPDDYFFYNSGFKNFFENTIAINFNHRWIATISFFNIIFLTCYLRFAKKIYDKNFEISIIILFVFLQFILGLLTLLSNVKIYFASMHQINSMLLLGSLIYIYYSIKKGRKN